MRLHQWMAAKAGNGLALALALVLSGALTTLVYGAHSSPLPSQAKSKLESSVFTYDGQDFVRAKTTLMTKEGKSAVNTKLDRDTPAYKALSQKRSYIGDATAFGRKFDAYYAPLTSEDGKLTGALFVGAEK
jgi:methyl-accepting chemotaxis protein